LVLLLLRSCGWLLMVVEAVGLLQQLLAQMCLVRAGYEVVCVVVLFLVVRSLLLGHLQIFFEVATCVV